MCIHFLLWLSQKIFRWQIHFTDDEMKEMASSISLLSFRCKRDRGIEPFIVNWNIYMVSTEFGRSISAVRERNDTRYNRQRIYPIDPFTQVIHEYPDLAGIGITLADWMSNFNNDPSPLPAMTPRDQEEWISQTIIQGIKDAK